MQFLIECRSKNKSFFLPRRRRTEALTLFSPLLSLLSPLAVSSLRTLSLSRRPIECCRISRSPSHLYFYSPSFLSYGLVNRGKIRAGSPCPGDLLFFLCADEAEDDTRILLSAFVIISDAFYMLGDCFPIMIL